MTPELRQACERALHVLTSAGETLKAGRGMLFILEQIGYRRLARLLRLPPFVWGVELGYRIVASNRTVFSRVLFRNS